MLLEEPILDCLRVVRGSGESSRILLARAFPIGTVHRCPRIQVTILLLILARKPSFTLIQYRSYPSGGSLVLQKEEILMLTQPDV